MSTNAWICLCIVEWVFTLKALPVDVVLALTYKNTNDLKNL